jgi:Na+/H+ antiporter NhaD/arsenite permease-like protein
MDTIILAIFIFVYAGMILGELPYLKIDRTGIAVLGAIALIAAGKITPQEAWLSVDVPTIGLTMGLMIVSAQFRLSGGYAALTQKIASASFSPPALLGLLIAVAALLSAVLANDIVCLAMAPILLAGCSRRGLNPIPFLIALACASNVGSAATLIGNPQNILIGEYLKLSFNGYLAVAAIPSVLGLVAVWLIIVLLSRRHWYAQTCVPEIRPPEFSRWQTTKGFVVVVALMLFFVVTPWPRDVTALAAAGILLMSRRMASHEILGLVDWHLILLFIGLFVVNYAIGVSGIRNLAAAWLLASGVDISSPRLLFLSALILSNLVSNVPATMLLLPHATHPMAGPILALASTLAGNLFIVGSIANIIVVIQAKRMGVVISWRDHARIGVPVTITTLSIAAAWLWLIMSVFRTS